MKLHSVRGGSVADLEAKKYTIGVGISLGNKWFTPENIVGSIEWALQHSKDKVVVYVADSIHGINISVRNNISLEKGTRKAVAAGAKLFDKVRPALKNLSKGDLNRIVFVTWDEIVDEKFKEKLSYLYSLYERDGEFRDTIHNLVKNHTSKEQRVFSEDEIHRFGQYVVEEMPEFLMRVSMKGIKVDAYTYPSDNILTQFAEKIQKGEIFPYIKEKLIDTEPKVFLEVR